ncbi:DNA-binding MarR family transcriptional regulator [Altererythrobacter atlanticus]|uniref:HTH-type transcriptional repressor NicR n=1 Tax=Croceibacterium atlanticum TaxID=1267766 RepID=A0A0F7KYN1_9SPHN|nr:MarR family winged helix-turn-helix transcriptional regulator [Croceibacterium atlanticum]AKH43905.1 HTH-type transcriptional repressor NicR [Croceibacterium atlanticum]MBB5733645.1 DNA-binding MarR family transcriptional regulator [Croceibacterium atlanticum]
MQANGEKRPGRRDAEADQGGERKINKVGTLHQLLKLTNRLMAPFSTHLADRYSISMNEFRMLMAIGWLGPCASHELSEHTGVNAMSVSRAVATLEKHGRISVEPDPRNRRRKTLRLTEEGERLYAIMRPQSVKVAEYLLHKLSDEDVAALDRIMDVLICTLEATDDRGNSLFLESTRPEGEQADED